MQSLCKLLLAGRLIAVLEAACMCIWCPMSHDGSGCCCCMERLLSELEQVVWTSGAPEAIVGQAAAAWSI